MYQDVEIVDFLRKKSIYNIVFDRSLESGSLLERGRIKLL